VSDIEIDRGGVSYTVETVKQVSAMHPKDDLFLIIGMDMLQDFSNWRSPEEILEYAELVVLTRPEFPMPRLEPHIRRRIQVCRMPEIGISSSEIRRRVKEGKSILYIVPAGVSQYIDKHRLYR
jgi:nicotinate-nucleotide adenylyltransferase